MEGGDAALQVARQHARHGTTALLATTMTAPYEDLEAALRAVGGLCRDGAPGAARVLWRDAVASDWLQERPHIQLRLVA